MVAQLRPVHPRAVAAEMLAVGAPLSTITTATTATLPPPFATATATATTTTSSAVSSTLRPPLLLSDSADNVSLNLPQRDQPGHLFKGDTPDLPEFWAESTHRKLYIKNRYGLYLEMWPNGHTQGVPEPSLYYIFVFISHFSNLVIKGYVSDKYLCMNPQTTELYTRKDVHEDCYIRNTIRNGSSMIVYSYKHCRTPADKQCYLGTYRNGTMRTGALARQSQYTAQWLAHSASHEETKSAADLKEEIRKQGGRWTPPTTAPPPLWPKRPRRIVSQKEQRRKRVRRWCRNLTVIQKRPKKFLRRCKRDCGVLKKMIRDPQRYKRRCLKSLVRRRIRNQAKKGAGAGAGPQAEGGVVMDSRNVSAIVQRLLPRQGEIFQRLRRLRRCKNTNKLRPCTPQEVRRNEKRRREKRKKKKKKSSSSSSSSSAATPVSPGSRPPRRKIRHQRRRTNRERRHRLERGVRPRDTADEFKSKSEPLTASPLTKR